MQRVQMEPRSGPGSPRSLRQANRHRVLATLAESGPLTQADLARATGLAASTVSALVHELADAGDLVVGRRDGAKGSRLVRLATPPGVVAGLDHGRLHLAVAVADLDGEILADKRVRIPEGMTAAESAVELDRLLTEVLAAAGRERSDVRRGALALPAPVDISSGRLGSAAILPRWAGIDPATLCADILGFPVSVHNDTNVGAIGEAREGAGRGLRHFAYIWVSEGLGAGLMVNDALYEGTSGIAGELGHTLQRSEHGDLCRCGNRGCLETLVSTPAVIRLLEPQVGPLVDFDEILRRIRAGDSLCRRVLEQTGRHIGVAVANLVNLLNPQRVIVGGELSSAGDVLLEPIRQMVIQYAIPSAAERVDIVLSALGKRSEVIGAAKIALGQERAHWPNAEAGAS
ncbi:MAG: ROK family transcriptional regulator [Micropruina sp.]